MKLTPTAEQEELRQSVRRFLADKSSSGEVRRLIDTEDGYSSEVWGQMATQLGLQSLHIPEQYGGQGFTFFELAIVLEEMGRAVFGGPYFATVCLAANAIMNTATAEARAALLPELASGRMVATLAFTEDSGRWDAEGVTMQYERDGDDYKLHGVKLFVLDGQTADLILVVARMPGSRHTDRISVFAVAADAPGLTKNVMSTMDMTRRQARLDFAGVPAKLVSAEGEAWPGLARTLAQGAACLAAEQSGGIQRCLEMAVDYAKVRTQFGQAIGSFQAIKHKCADMLVAAESAKSASYYAAWAATEDLRQLPIAASLAQAFCSEAYVEVAAENIQVHGGIGFTWEHDAHLHFRRAKSSASVLGGSTYHRDLIAQQLKV